MNIPVFGMHPAGPRGGRPVRFLHRAGRPTLVLAAFVLFAFCERSPRAGTGGPSGGAGSARADTVALAARSVSIAAAGDVMMAGSALETVRKNGPDFCFDSTAFLLRSADFAVANLEAPFGTGGKAFAKTFTFRVPPEYAPALVRAGFDAVNLANNHILDFGLPPFFETLRLLDSLGIGHCGAGPDRDAAESGCRVLRNGWKAAFLGFSLTYPEQFWASGRRPGTAFAVRERVAAAVDSARRTADLVVVSFHWGKELHSLPEPYQREFGHAAVDAGADLVLGHHPHVLQGFELYRGKPIAYSLGNFVFGSKSASCVTSALFIARFDSSGFTGGETVPLCVDYKKVEYRPQPLHGIERERAIDSINRMSEKFNGGRPIFTPAGKMEPRTGERLSRNPAPQSRGTP
jgi:poly-gamma-glutamate capsule biosynthesis protein CapA/YwtB (metallophosphatase superfamily)